MELPWFGLCGIFCGMSTEIPQKVPQFCLCGIFMLISKSGVRLLGWCRGGSMKEKGRKGVTAVVKLEEWKGEATENVGQEMQHC